MGFIRVLTVFGTRPEAIKLFPVIHALEADHRFDNRTCVTGQHREILDQVLALAGIVPDHDLTLMRDGQTLDQLTARALTGIGQVLDAERPDWVVVQGDTTSAFAAALAAHYRKIPVCHVEAGLRSANTHHPWPEEANRRMISSFADLHCAPTQRAADALRTERGEGAQIHLTGNTVVDALEWVTQRIMQQPDLACGLAEWERRFTGRKILAVTTHRRENLGAGLINIARSVHEIARRSDIAVIFPVHPNPQVRSVMQAELGGRDNVALIEPLDYPHFARLLAISHLVLTDSGGVQEEAPSLGKPVLVPRETTERPEGIEAGTAKLVGTDPIVIEREIARLLDDPAAHAAMARAHNPYGDGRAAMRIGDLLAG
ncbi:non-hydrolyzing UDP-N-acetylglucosamine 2-epimerase [Qipengyuania vesicularis]|uniref:non-hydrolyzing UDP-N-acetylglucosamine 2-epimerase n=1 Tax=Qipengyuania vesicularis TaxID=2867232 RepID=UPI001C874A4A|nr:UDP-N-acetylglucosamine 2-epimerase (non-hydrolyzing) [Qipengyuania vesicularis]MBX7528287.1 UDP-N-acetylglucosamine 2-epimerase (non-hydrolyzing) [Qipengyuania vesicularis]